MVVATATEGDVNSATPALGDSAMKAAFGPVNGFAVEVTQFEAAPLMTELHPNGNAGALTPSKSWEIRKIGVPTGKANVSVPRFCDPS